MAINPSESICDYDVKTQHSPGLHICILYSDEQERRVSIKRFVKSVLAQNDMFLYVADTTHDPTPEWLPKDTSSSEQFSAKAAKQVYCPDGEFIPTEMVARLQELLHIAIEKGYRRFSGTGEMSWVNNGWPGSERLIEYELLLNELVEECEITLLCQYNINVFDGGTLLDILRVHPMVLVKGQIINNPFFRSRDKDKAKNISALHTDNKVLAELMLVQGMLYTFPSQQKIGEFINKAILNVPGCCQCETVFEDTVSSYKLEDMKDRRDGEKFSISDRNSFFHTIIKSNGRWSFAFLISDHLYGHLQVEIDDPSLFGIYEPYVQTLVNSVATTLENRWQQGQLEDEISQHKLTSNLLIEVNKKLEKTANTDSLTGLYNRRYCFKKIREEVIRGQRFGQQSTLVLVDMNNLKRVNDGIGHSEGDRLLKTFSNILNDVLRQHVDFAFRIGGDEFVILLANCELLDAQLVCKRLDKDFTKNTEIASLAYGLVEISESFAVEDKSSNYTWLEDLLKIADKRMYEHKTQRKTL